MAVSATQLDATIRHTVLLERFKAGEVRKVVPFLREIDAGIRDRLSRGNLTEFSRARLEALLADVEALIERVLKRYHTALYADLRALSASEAAFEARSLKNAAGFNAVTPGADQVYAAVMAAPLSVRGPRGGLLLEQLIINYTEAQKKAVSGAIRRGVFEGKTNNQILQEVRGTRARRFQDGIIGYAKRQNEAVVRTAIRHVSSVARLETFKANAVEEYQWISTLDGRTSDICQSLDGRVFKSGQGPVPPAHINCRSDIVAVLGKEYDFLDKDATRASKDGPVDATETYYSWLKKQPAPFQDAAIGPTRAKLLREGGLSAERFARMRLSKDFQPLTLAEMQKLEPLAFQRAGIKIDPATGRAIY